MNGTWQVTAPRRCFEWCAFAGGPAPANAAAPGAIERDASGAALALHFAPNRWLLPELDEALRAQLQAAEAQGRGALTEVTGRWCAMGVEAELLAAGMPLELVLRERGVAALWAFDCPLLVARRANGFEVWVEASYLSGLLAMLDELRHGRSCR